MQKVFDQIIDDVLKKEGGYSNDPDDNGGETNYGITAAVWRENGYTGPIKNAPLELARRIYFARYIQRPRFDEIYAINAQVGVELIDTGVNMGPGTAAIFFQRALNGLNLGDYQDLFVDGAIGKLSIDAFKKFYSRRGVQGCRVMYRLLNGVQANRYLDITERDKRQRKFLFGWILQRVGEWLNS